MGTPMLLSFWGIQHEKKPDPALAPSQDSELTGSSEPEPGSDNTDYGLSFPLTLKISSENLRKLGSKPPAVVAAVPEEHPLLARARQKHEEEKRRKLESKRKLAASKSFLVTLKLSPEKLGKISVVGEKTAGNATAIKADPTKRDDSRQVQAQSVKAPVADGPVHPFFSQFQARKSVVKAKKQTSDTLTSANQNTSLIVSRDTPVSSGGHLEKSKEPFAENKPAAPDHPFFTQFRQRRDNGASKEFVPTSLSYSHRKGVDPPWSINHVRAQTQTFPRTRTSLLPKAQKGKFASLSIDTDEMVHIISHPLNFSGQTVINKPKRVLFTGSRLKQLALDTISPHSISRLQYLVDKVDSPKAFDLFTCENQPWATKYAPKTTKNLISSSTSHGNVLEWTKKKIDQLRKFTAPETSLKKKRKRMDDFIVDDDEILDPFNEEDQKKSDFLILCGPPGSTKTSTVFAVASELNAFVFEINASTKRAGKDVLQLLEGIGHSHVVHSSKTQILKRNTIILLEEVDVLFQDENSFWPSIEKFASTSRRPIIMTCNDPNRLPEDLVNREGAVSFSYFASAPMDLAVDCLWLIALNEGHLLQKEKLFSLWSQSNQDIRQCINTLQFWCQLGVGGKKSGIDWYCDEAERQLVRERTGDDNVRVISQDTLPDLHFEDKNGSSVSSVSSFDDIVKFSESVSLADYFDNNTQSNISNDINCTDGELIGYRSFSETSLRSDPLDFELKPAEYLRPFLPFPIEDVNIKAKMDMELCRDAFSFLSYQYSWNRIGNSTTNNCIDCSTPVVMTTEIAPYIRDIALNDMRKEIHKQSVLSQHTTSGSSLRLSNRSLVSLGLYDSQKYFGDGVDLEAILDTGGRLRSFAAPINQ